MISVDHKQTQKEKKNEKKEGEEGILLSKENETERKKRDEMRWTYVQSWERQFFTSVWTKQEATNRLSINLWNFHILMNENNEL